ncbi:DGQHR domain-containing protein [Sphingobacterium faecium]
MDKDLKLKGLINRQWLTEWDTVKYDEQYRRKPSPHFYMFSIKASTLKRLSKVYPRTADGSRGQDSGIQRKHDPIRSTDIKKYVHGGFPWSELSAKQKSNSENDNLKMPGWLPTAIIANILTPGTKRGNEELKGEHSIQVEDIDKNICQLTLPHTIHNEDWDPEVAPIEIIDGQHRLWAFDKDEDFDGDFEFPVIAFYDLDITWQAYLFYTINIKPKKINASLAFDLYPILRVQEWLEHSAEGNKVYKETRAQELTELLWSHNKSPWYKKINMLGDSKGGLVTQAAFIRSLLASFIKGNGNQSIGGLFGSKIETVDKEFVLNWNRPQQAAFLILIWSNLLKNISKSDNVWTKLLREENGQQSLEGIANDDSAFTSKYSLLSTDQGVRGVLHIYNDLCYINARSLHLETFVWKDELKEDFIDIEDVNKALNDFSKTDLENFIDNISKVISNFNWVTSSTPKLSDSQRKNQMVFKGSSGYKELRSQLLQELIKSEVADVKKSAEKVLRILNY